MRVILEIFDNKAASLIDVLKSISFLKIEAISSAKADFLKELKSPASAGLRPVLYKTVKHNLSFGTDYKHTPALW